MRDIEIKYRNIEKIIDKEMKNRSDKALDEIFSQKSKEAPWIQPTMKNKEDLIKAVKLASNKINESQETTIIVCDGDLKKLLEFIYIASDSKKEIYFLGDSLSTLEYSKAIKAMEKEDFSLIAISDGNESVEMICAFTLARKALFKKYSLDKAQEKVYVVAPNGSSYFMKEAAENKYVRMHYEENVTSPKWLMTPALLLPTTIMGVNLKELLDGFEEMVTSIIWDKDGINLANTLINGNFKIDYSETEYKLLEEYIESRLGRKTVLDYDKETAIINFSVEETNRDIITPVFPGCNPEGSMKLMAEENRNNKIDFYEKEGNPIVEIRLNEFKGKSIGSLIYYIEMTIAIMNRLI